MLTNLNLHRHKEEIYPTGIVDKQREHAHVLYIRKLYCNACLFLYRESPELIIQCLYNKMYIGSYGFN
jgi:hypothetical protein